LAREPGEREEFLDRVCAGVPSLRKEVEALIATNKADGSLRETPRQGSDGTVIESETDSLVGQTLGHYRVVSLIGSGGMGQVYLAEDPRLGRKVALKTIAQGPIGEARSRFMREARLASAFDHPNICAIHDVGESSGQCFIAMQYIEGQSLKQLIGGRPLPLDTLLPIALQIADALGAAHQRSIIHRDIKPGNIIVTSRGQAKVLDFGLAKLLVPESPDILRTEGVVGTPAYMSPEQARGGEADHRSDIFSFGAVLFHMATGSAPFHGESSVDVMRAVITERHAPPRELKPDMPPALAAVIDRAMAKSPADRYQSVEEMASDLRAIAEQISLPTHPAFVSARRRRRLTNAAFVAVSLAVVLGWFAWHTASLRWARQQVPAIERLAQAGRSFEAYDLAVRVRKYRPGDPALTRLMLSLADSLSVTSEPAGAQVYLKRFVPGRTSESLPATFVGTTPISKLEVARGSYVVSVHKDGFAPFQRTWFNAASGSLEAPIPGFPPIEIEANLMPAGKAPAGMVFIPGGNDRLATTWGQRPTDAKVILDDYFIDKFEVSNREYKEFIDADGYRNPSYWPQSFVENGSTLSRAEALRTMVDTTRQPGPRNWSGGTYPEGKADHPVTNITWYEAAAYAAFRGKSLPTIFQWEKAARYRANNNFLGVTMPWEMHDGSIAGRANLNTRGTVSGGSFEFGMSPFGCYDMAGNVAEWCVNETSEGFITSGGSFASLPQAWGFYGSYPAFRYSDEIGFRCVLNSAGPSNDQGAMAINIEPDVPHFDPLPEKEVRTFFAHYEYDKEAPLGARVARTETNEWWRDKIEYNGADGQRALAYLYVPKHFPAPHQVIHLFPAGDVTQRFRTVPQSIEADYGSLVRSGRAVFAVVLGGFLERDLPAGWVDFDRATIEYVDGATIEYVEAMAKHIIELRRGLDYLLARGDVDAGRMAFMGNSFGGPMMVLPTIESRYGAVILVGPGIGKTREHPAANAVNFVPLIQPPKLLVHGIYDEASPMRTVAEPLLNLLTEPKEMFPYPGGHRPDPEELVQVVNAWLDDIFGPVRPNLAQR
jgi:formylglycine-generating enzyme required for sulfatase activity/dienelactone hydrolase